MCRSPKGMSTPAGSPSKYIVLEFSVARAQRMADKPLYLSGMPAGNCLVSFSENVGARSPVHHVSWNAAWPESG